MTRKTNMIKYYLPIILFCITLIFFINPVSANIFSNPSFEEGFTGWAVDCMTHSSTHAYDGTYSARLYYGGALAGNVIRYNYDLTGVDEISMYYKIVQGSGMCARIYTNCGTVKMIDSPTGVCGWSLLTLNVSGCTAPGVLRFGLVGGSGLNEGYIDYIYSDDPPPPPDTTIIFNPGDDIQTSVPNSFNYSINSSHSPFIVYAYIREYSDVGTYPYNYTGHTDTFMGFLELENEGNELDAIFGNSTFSHGPIAYYGKRSDMYFGCMQSFGSFNPYAASVHMFMTACSNYELDYQPSCYIVPPFGTGTQIAYDAIVINESYEGEPQPTPEPSPDPTPDPTPDETPTPEPTSTPQPDPEPINETLNTSFTYGYNLLVDESVDGFFEPVYNFTDYTVQPLTMLNQTLKNFTVMMNETFNTTSFSLGLSTNLLFIIMSGFPQKIINVFAYYLCWVILLLIFKGQT